MNSQFLKQNKVFFFMLGQDRLKKTNNIIQFEKDKNIMDEQKTKKFLKLKN